MNQSNLLIHTITFNGTVMDWEALDSGYNSDWWAEYSNSKPQYSENFLPCLFSIVTPIFPPMVSSSDQENATLL
jgi:hypothetical protein